MKKIITLFISVVMIVCCIPFSAVTVAADTVPTYYVAADGKGNGLSEDSPMSLKYLNSNVYIFGGSRVLFKCGDIFYGNITPILKETSESAKVEFGCYGKGTLPIISGAKIALNNWEREAGGFFKYDLTDKDGFGGVETDITNIGFIEDSNGVKYGARRLNAEECTKEYDFYCDEQYLYLKSVKNPYEALGELRLATGISLLSISSNMVIHDLNLRDAGYGIVWKEKKAETTKNVHIYNCVIENMGGHYIGGLNSGTKGGNGIEFYSYAENCIVENNIIRNCYDVGFTCQGNGIWKNVTVKNNIFAYNTQSIEVWLKTENPDRDGVFGLDFYNNICIAQGESWGYDVRPNKRTAADVLSYYYQGNTWDMSVKNNVFFHKNSQGAVYYNSSLSFEKFVSDVNPVNNIVYIPSATTDIHREENISKNMEVWKTLSDKNSSFNIVSDYSKYENLLSLSEHSNDFNKILSEAKAVGFNTAAVELTREANIVPNSFVYTPIGKDTVDKNETVTDKNEKTDVNISTDSKSVPVIPIAVVSVCAFSTLALAVLIILMKKHKI
ncbi:MAG: hypothetical protein IKD04_06755 [Clostridia bacterium]|nr:hypothetical protein [Clostridia bacterium]